MRKARSQAESGVSAYDLAAITEGRLDDPFAVLGPCHRGRAGLLVAFDPHATQLGALTESGEVSLKPLGRGVFAGDIGTTPYRLRGSDGARSWEYDDPYRFAPVLGALDLHLIGEGTHWCLWQALGAHPMRHERVEGVHFALWAPNARRVSVVGEFNAWDGRRAPMRRRDGGVWEIFLPGLQPGARYKFEILPAGGGPPLLKADPLARQTELPPATASRIAPAAPAHDWCDGGWMEARAARNSREAPISIYELHLGSWRHHDGHAPGFGEIAAELVEHVRALGFTHIELMPLAEHPFGGSWGYQPTGLYAPTARHGTPDDLRALIDAAHGAGLGVIMDWVPAHFPADAHGLARFDGTALYEHEDPREGFHPDWHTLIYNFGRNEVRNFLTANALYWLREFHLDGLRVDAVASMLYRDYSRGPGQWLPNRDGGRENYEAIAFVQEVNRLTHAEAPPGIMMMAEESTAWPGVTSAVHEGGLGFGFKWNMGWMNDTLRFMAHDPIHRRHHHDLMTFALTYAFSENYVLPISHDEVVHGKGAMLAKMPGDRDAKFANLRAYYGFMWGHPGKKLLFMGCEFGQAHEWNHDAPLDWGALKDPLNAGLMRLVGDLNALYRATPALHARDCEPSGFRWIEREARDESLFAWARLGGPEDAPVVVVANLTPVERRWRLGLPRAGRWREVLNTDAAAYGGGNRGNLGALTASAHPLGNMPASAEITLPPLATLFLLPE
ncbi:MAG: 1,4-alpha-glucan branching protein GlgB [Pararhodobacter sp.]|nr:1,4-alpha-glucan branching protein GlgB [Pararhodobacter sp.]